MSKNLIMDFSFYSTKIFIDKNIFEHIKVFPTTKNVAMLFVFLFFFFKKNKMYYLLLYNSIDFFFIKEYSGFGLKKISSLFNSLTHIHPYTVIYSFSMFFFFYRNKLNKGESSLNKILLLSIFSCTLGSFWSYQEILWGGWWNWDDIEYVVLSYISLLLLIHHFFFLKKNNNYLFFFDKILLFYVFLVFMDHLPYGESIHKFKSNNFSKYTNFLVGVTFLYLFFFFKKSTLKFLIFYIFFSKFWEQDTFIYLLNHTTLLLLKKNICVYLGILSSPFLVYITIQKIVSYFLSKKNKSKSHLYFSITLYFYTTYFVCIYFFLEKTHVKTLFFSKVIGNIFFFKNTNKFFGGESIFNKFFFLKNKSNCVTNTFFHKNNLSFNQQYMDFFRCLIFSST